MDESGFLCYADNTILLEDIMAPKELIFKEHDFVKKCRITVLKREFYADLAAEYIPIPDFGPCEMMKEGDVFLTGGPFGNECPKDFCAMAWQAICLQATTLAGGGKVFGHDLVHIACCNDGVRPVVFKLEAYEDDQPPIF